MSILTVQPVHTEFTPKANEEDVVETDVKQGRLANSTLLNILDYHLSSLNLSKCSDVIEIIHQHLELFKMYLLVPMSSIKQHPYRVNPDKIQVMRKWIICIYE